jgi:hypothetical protein
MKTKPTKFKSASQMIELWQLYCDDIVENGFTSVPTQTGFCKWLSAHYESADRKTIYNSLNKIFPNIKSEFEQIQGDVIAEGGMLGKYQPTMSIFALKNWCKWVDKQEDNVSVIDEATRNEVNDLVSKLSEQYADEKSGS